jgi:hypothetical protein
MPPSTTGTAYLLGLFLPLHLLFQLRLHVERLIIVETEDGRRLLQGRLGGWLGCHRGWLEQTIVSAFESNLHSYNRGGGT